MPYRRTKAVAFDRAIEILPAPNYKRQRAPVSTPIAQRNRLHKEISKLEHEFSKTQRARHAYEKEYERTHSMRKRSDQARIMAYVVGCRAREAVLQDSLNEAKDMLAIAVEDDLLRTRGYARSYVDRMEDWRRGVVRDGHGGRRR